MTEFHIVLVLIALVAIHVATALWLRSAWRADASVGGAPLGGGERGGGGADPAVRGGRRADDFSAFRAVAGEIAKRQVAVLATMAEELQAYDRACLAHARRLCELMLAEGRRAGFDGLPETLPNDLDSVMRTLVRLSDRPLDAAAQGRIRKDVEPNATVLLGSAERTTSRLEENRFWLGMMLEQELHTYVAGMAQTFAGLQPAPEVLRQSEARFRALLAGHPEASRAIERLSSSRRTPSSGPSVS